MIDLKKLRHDHGFTQDYVSQKSTVSRTQISNHENGRFDTVIEQLSKIVGVYGYELKLVKIGSSKAKGE